MCIRMLIHSHHFIQSVKKKTTVSFPKPLLTDFTKISFYPVIPKQLTSHQFRNACLNLFEYLFIKPGEIKRLCFP